MSELILMFVGGFCTGIFTVCAVGFYMLKKQGNIEVPGVPTS